MCEAPQAEKRKEAAIRAAQERAAQDYKQEVQKLNAMKIQNEARINEKVKKAKQKARKKEESLVNAEEVRALHMRVCGVICRQASLSAGVFAA